MKYNFQQIASGLIIPALVLLVGLMAYFVLLPGIQEVRARQDVLNREEQKLAETTASLADVQGLVEEFQEKRKSLEVIDQSIPAAPEIPELLGSFDFLASQSGAVIASLQLRPAQTLETAQAGTGTERLRRLQEIFSQTQNLGAIDIELTLTGNYQNLKAFLANLERNLRFMDVQQIIISGRETETGLQEYSLLIQTYHQRQ